MGLSKITNKLRKHYVCNCREVIKKDFPGLAFYSRENIFNIAEIKGEGTTYNHAYTNKNNHPTPVVIPFGCKIYTSPTNIPGILLVQYKRHLDCLDRYSYAYVSCDAIQKCCIYNNSIMGDFIMINGPSCSERWYVNWFPQFGLYSSYKSKNVFETTLKLLSIFNIFHQEAIDSFCPGLMNVLQEYYDTLNSMNKGYYVFDVFEGISGFIDELIESMENAGGKIYIKYPMPYDIFKSKITHEESKSLEEDEKKIEEEKAKAFMSSIKNRRSLLTMFNNM